MNELSKRIKQRREELGLSQDELAKKSGLSKNAIWNYENGKRKPTLDAINKVATALDTTPSELMGWNKTEIISPVTIGVMISAFIEGDKEKGINYANFIADKYHDSGKRNAENIIRKRIDGSYKNENTVTLDETSY